MIRGLPPGAKSVAFKITYQGCADAGLCYPPETKQLAYSVLTDAQKHRFEENLELDFSFGLKGMSRFRANLFNQKGAVGAVFRSIPYEIKSFEALALPKVVSDLCKKPRGLVLVTGPTGSGKSTTLASMVDDGVSEGAALIVDGRGLAVDARHRSRDEQEHHAHADPDRREAAHVQPHRRRARPACGTRRVAALPAGRGCSRAPVRA